MNGSVLTSNWFLCSMIILIICARLYPTLGAHGGILMPEITVKVFAVAAIFFVSGLSLKSEELASALFQVNPFSNFLKTFFKTDDDFLQWRIHLTIQLFTLLGIPLLVQLLLPFLRFLVPDENIIRG